MDIKETKSDFQLLSTAVQTLRIDNGFLTYNERNPGEKHINVAYKITEVKKSEEDKRILGLLTLRIEILVKEEKTLHLLMEMIGFFSAPDEMDEAVFRRMLTMNGCASLYSIARASISSISSQIFTYGSILLPMVNFIRFHEMEEEKEQPET